MSKRTDVVERNGRFYVPCWKCREANALAREWRESVKACRRGVGTMSSVEAVERQLEALKLIRCSCVEQLPLFGGTAVPDAENNPYSNTGVKTDKKPNGGVK